MPDPTQTVPSDEEAGPLIKERAQRLASTIKERALATTETKKGVLSEEVGALAQKLDEIATHDEGEARLHEQVASRGARIFRRLQTALQEHSTEDLLARAEQQIKARPGLVIAGCLALGFIGARLVRR
jgi:hypothetical protein